MCVFQSPPASRAAPELLLSASKYRHLPKDDDTSTDEEEEEENEGDMTIRPAELGGGAEGISTEEAKKSPNYVKLDLGEASGSATGGQRQSGGKDGGNYVKIDHSKQAPPPPPPPAPPFITPQIAVQQASLQARREP